MVGNIQNITRTATELTANILIVGGSYSGLSALIALKNHLSQRQLPHKVSVAFVEPKAGLLNILGVPRSIVDTEFAKTQFIPFQDLHDISFDKLVSDDQYVIDDLGKHLRPHYNDYMEITFVQGSVESLTSKTAQYHLNSDEKTKGTINFDYAVVASGRNRSWPTSPAALNYESYMNEMIEFNESVKKCNNITVVGAGAVGCEIAGDIKTKYPSKVVNLIHPHETFPPEPLTDKFKEAVRDSLERAHVNVMTGLRVKKSDDLQHLEFTNGEKLATDFTYWCASFRNNTDLFLGEFDRFLSPKNNVYVNKYLQLALPSSDDVIENVFCIGDMIELPIIKSAGWAMYMGRLVANNLASLVDDKKLVEEFVDITKMPRGMVIVAGNGEIVSELTEEVELNHKGYVEEYKDYCIGKIRATLGA